MKINSIPIALAALGLLGGACCSQASVPPEVAAYQAAVLATPNLISYYEFDAGNANDNFGANNGTLYNLAGFTPGLGKGPDQALNLEGTSSDNLGTVSAFDFTSGKGTIEMWVRADWTTETGRRSIVGNSHSASPYFNYTISMAADKSDIVFWNASGYWALPLSGVGTNWHHLAVVFDAATFTVVWDGVSQVSPYALVWNGLSGGQTQLGSDQPSGGAYLSYPWIGNLDEVAFYSTNLSVGSIQAHYTTYTAAKPVIPAIVKQPAGSSTWYVGHPGTLSIVATGTQPQYRWYQGSSLLAGATNSVLSLPSVVSGNAGTYTCVAGNSSGSVTSSPAVVVVSAATPSPVAAYQASVLATPGLISYYSYDAGTANDDFRANNGTLIGAASFPNGIGGGPDTALNLDGDYSADNLGLVSAFDFSSAKGTIEMWVRAGWADGAETWASRSIVGNYHGAVDPYFNYTISMSEGKTAILYWRSGYWGPILLPANAGTNWHHLAVVFDASTWTLIWDGVSVETHSTGVWPGFGSDQTTLGSDMPNGVKWLSDPWIGELDEVAFYSTNLPVSSIQAHRTAFAGPLAPAIVQVSRLQSPQVLSGPGFRSDIASRAFWNGSMLSKYVSAAYAYNMRGGDTRSVSEAWDFYEDTSSVSLSPGSAGSFDDVGAWLIHAEVAPENTNLVRGWYHAEQNRPPANNLKSMAYCESTDGGRTFEKVCAIDATRNYPNNQIITSWTGFVGDVVHDGVGDGRIVKVGGYYYCYFGANADWRIHVARSAVADGGRPGTWWKYYDPAGAGGTNGTWTEPGLGGNSSSPFSLSDLFGAEVTWNADMNQFMTDVTRFTDNGFCGISLAFSTNNVFGWQRAPYPLYPFEGVWPDALNWDRNAIPAKEIIGICGFTALDGATDGQYPPVGSTRFGNSFWFEPTFINAKEGVFERYLLRQKVTLSQTGSSDPKDQVGQIELGLFRHRDGTDDWATTYNTFGHYRKVQTLGYLCTANIPGTVPLYNAVYYTPSASHLLSPVTNGLTKLSLLGYMFTNPVSGTIPLYRTYNAPVHSATTNASAPGVEYLLGYIFPPVGDETFAYRYDATEQTEVVNGGAEGVALTRAGEQGYHNWFFNERLSSGALTALIYSPSVEQSIPYPNNTQVWASASGGTGAKINAYGGNPGTTNSAVREWVAIDTGIVYVSARAFSLVAAGGDSGVRVLIQKNGQLLWQVPVANGLSSANAVSFGKWLTVNIGDVITFEIAPTSTTSKNDNTYFHPTIWFEWGSLSSSSLNPVLSLQTNVLSIRWPSITNQVYMVESTPNLNTGVWLPASPPILAAPPTNTFVLMRTNASTYYRVRVVK